MPTTRRRLGGRGGRGSLAVTDQAVFAGSHFVMNVLLARWMTPEEYGVFTVVYAVFLLAAAAHTGLLVEPAVVHGSGRYRSSLSKYLPLVVRVHWRLSLLLGVALVLGGAVLNSRGGQGTGPALMGIGAITPAILYLWLIRKAAYIPGAIHLAVLGGVAYGTALLGGLALLRATGLLDPLHMFLLMGVAALPAGAGIQLGVRRAIGWDGARKQGGEREEYRRSATREGFRYGRWAAGVHMLMWVTSNAFYVVVGGLVSVQAAGSMRAVMNVFLPVQHTVIGIASAMLPAMSRGFTARGLQGVRREGWLVAAFMIPAALLYSVLVGYAGDALLDLAYAGQYNEDSHLLLLALPLPLLWVGVSLLGNALRAAERPNDVFWGYGVAGILVLLAAVPLIARFGVEAAILAWGGSLLASFLVMLLLFTRHSARHPGD